MEGFFRSAAGLAVGAIIIFGFAVPRGLSIKCYQCNSEYDPRCGDPFDSFSIGEVDCNMKPKHEHLENLNATLCRKIVQKVYGKLRYIRTCGYVGDVSPEDGKLCVQRSGTYEVNVQYCACKGDLCNGASSRQISELLLLLVTLVTLRKHVAIL